MQPQMITLTPIVFCQLPIKYKISIAPIFGFFYIASNFLRLTSLFFLLLSWYSTFKTIISVKHYENCNLLRLRVTQNALKFSFYFLSFSFSSMLLDGETEVIFIFFFDCWFKPVWPALKLLIWYAVCFQAMFFRDTVMIDWSKSI